MLCMCIYTIDLISAWGYAFLSITVISLVGLLSVALVPVMQKLFYDHLIQFLVALAIGSLTGDAMLHLIPHVSNDTNEKNNNIFFNSISDNYQTCVHLEMYIFML